MQNEIIKECNVPSPNGKIENPGWARSEIMKYTRENIKAPWFRKKEWDYYLFTNKDYGLAFTISDLGYAALLSASILDFNKAEEHTETDLMFLTMHKKFGLGKSTSEADAQCHSKRLDLIFSKTEKGRHISCSFKNFDGDKDLKAELDVYEPDMEAMYICTPWKEKDTAFYYNCKMNCLRAEGFAKYGDLEIKFEKDSFTGCLDWGRGVWTYDNTWFWGTGSGTVNGEDFGFNLGYGFSDRSSASENVLYYKGKVHKLDEIVFGIPEDENGRQFMKTWKISSSDGRFEADFVPVIDRHAEMDFKIIASMQHQVFGKMTGYAVADDGERIEFSDYLCALEVVRNKY